MSNFIKAFFSFGLATSIEKLLGFIILPIYTGYFNTTQYGIIDMTSTILQVASIFGLLQLETSLQRYYYEYSALRKRVLVSNIYILIIFGSLIVALLLFLAAPYLSEMFFESREYANLIRLVSVQLPLTNLSMLGLVLLRFEKQNVKFLIVIVVKVVSTLAFVYLFVIYLDWGLFGVFTAQLSAIFCSTALVTFFVRHLFVMHLSKIMSMRNLRYALPQFPARVGSVALAQANRFFMLSFLSLSAIGIYSVSMKLASSIQLVNTAFIMAWAPFMHQQFKNENNKTVFANVFPLVVCLTFFCVCIIGLFSLEMVHLLADAKYAESSKYVGGLSLFFAFYIIKETVDIGPKLKEKTKFLSYTFFLSVIVNLVSLYFLIQHYELKGVILAMIITNLFLVIVSWTVSNKLYYIPFSKVKFISLLIPCLAVVVLCMYVELELMERILIALGTALYFGISGGLFYRNLKKVL